MIAAPMLDAAYLMLAAALASHLLMRLPLIERRLRAERLRQLGPSGALLILLAAPLARLLDQWLLAPLDWRHLSLLIQLPLLAALAWLLVRLYQGAAADASLWLLLLGNGAALSAMLLGERAGNLPEALAIGLLGGAGFWLMLRLYTDLLAHMQARGLPVAFRGPPTMLIAAGLLGLALAGLDGLVPT